MSFYLFIIDMGYEIEINRQIGFGQIKVVNNMNQVKIIWPDIY